MAAAEGARPAPARWATSARTSSTSRSSSPATQISDVSGMLDDLRQGAAARRRALRAALHGAVGAERRAGDRRRRRHLPGRFRGGALGVVRGHPVRHAAARTRIRIEVNGSSGSLAFDFEDMNVLEFFDAEEPGRDRRLPPDPGHRAGAPLRRRVVAGRPRARLRARLHPPGRRPRDRDRRGRRSPRRRSLTACRCSGCWPPSSAAPTAPAGGSRCRSDRSKEKDMTCLVRSRCSPASGPTCRSRRSPGSPPAGATTAWRSPAGATTSTRGRPPRTTPTCSGKLDLLEKYDLQGVRDLQPPQGPGGLRRPDRRPAPGDPVRAGLGRRRPRGCPAAGRRGDEDDRPDRRSGSA